MQPRPIPRHRRYSLPPLSGEARGRKRIDLVVTDYDFPDVPAGFDGAIRLKPEFRCTIPLAILSDEVSSEELRRAGRFWQSSPSEPIGADSLMRMIEHAFASLRGEAPAREPVRPTPSQQADEQRLARLTARERQVLAHVIAGEPNKRTAAVLGISRRTVEHHRAAIMHKTRAKSVPDLVRLALRANGSGDPDGTEP